MRFYVRRRGGEARYVTSVNFCFIKNGAAVVAGLALCTCGAEGHTNIPNLY